MRKLILNTFFLVLIFNVLAQNLVPNPSFETYSSCPTSVAQITNATGWMMISGHSGSSDFLHSCGSGLADVPNNAFGNQSPATGQGYAGQAMFYQSTPNFREYLQCNLSSPLVAGITYEVSFKVSLSENSSHAGSEFSVYFGNSPLTWSGGGWPPINTVTPQIEFSTYVADFTNWTTLTENYTAVGGEQYMVVGNFKNDASTTQTFVHAATYSTGYYYYDDFMVQAITVLPLELLSFTGHKSFNNSVLLDWHLSNTSDKGDFEVQRSGDGIHFYAIGYRAETDVPGYTFRDEKPLLGNNYYRLKQIDIEGEIAYSPVINVSFSMEEHQAYISPNPVQDFCTLYLGNVKETTNLYLMDITGKMLKSYEILPNEAVEMVLSLSDIPSGMYFLNIPNKTNLKLIKN